MSLPPPKPDATILITGASAGIGTELARQLAGRGHNVTLVARRKPRLDELAEELRQTYGVKADVHKCNLSSDRSRSTLIGKLQEDAMRVSAVCNNAGFGTFGRFHELDLEREAEEVRLNVGALQELTGAFLPPMVKRGEGAILNVASIAGFQPIPLNATYAATKAFVVAFSEAVHAELAGTGVSCTALCPGPVKTEFGEVAGVGEIEGDLPGFVSRTAAEVARAGIEGMVKGKRSVYPGLIYKATAAGGRFTPRSVLLPVINRLGGDRLGVGK